MPTNNSTKKSRRSFLQTSVNLGAMLPLMAATPSLGMAACKPNIAKKEPTIAPMKILILGGTSFLGLHQIAYALKRGHSVTTFTRGRTQPSIYKDLFKEVEPLVGDREDNLEALKGRKWDVVIDNSGRKVKWTKDTADLLKDNVEMYMYVSSVSVFYPYTGTDFTENRKLVLEIPKDITENEKYLYDYGVMKANSELASIEAFGKERATVIRPHFIVGPADRTDRFNYWPVRLAKGGEVILPGNGTEPVQYIDVRDLAGWMIRLLEKRMGGTFNAAGPGWTMTMPQFVHGAHAAFNTPISYVNIDDYDFLKKHQLTFSCPFVMPQEKFAGMSMTSNQKAIDSGLTFTPLAQTVKDTHDWWYSDAVLEARRQKVLTGERSFFPKEADVIKAWRKLKK